MLALNFVYQFFAGKRMMKRPLIRKSLLRDQLQVGNSTLYDWMNPASPRYDPMFPRPIKIGAASVAWVIDEIDEWVSSKIRSRDEG